MFCVSQFQYIESPTDCDKNARTLLREYDVLGEDADLYRKSDSTHCMLRELSLQTQTPKAIQQIDDRLRIITRLDHPNVVHLYDVYHDRLENRLFMVYECCKVQLVDVIIDRGRIDEETSKSMFRQLLVALCYLHRQDIVHGKIKPKALVTESKDVDEDSKLKLMFFPDHHVMDGEQFYDLDGSGVLTVRASSPYCVAPEVLTHRTVMKESDMWSAGVVLYIMLVGFPPFWTQPLFDEGHRKLKSRIIDGTFSMPPSYWDMVSKEAKDLVLKLLQTDASKRLTAEQALDHDWIREP